MPQQGFSSIGMSVLVKASELNYVTEISDIGSAPSELDATCFKDTVRIMTPGVRAAKAFEVTYLFDNTERDSDFRKLRGLQEAKETVPVAVIFPDGTTFLAFGSVFTYVTGAKVDELLQAKLVIFCQGDLEIIQTPYEITSPLQDSVGSTILDSSGAPILGRLVL